MCGIAGLISPNLAPEVRRHAVQCMVDRQLHRGPDEGAIWTDAHMTMGMRRLAIFDPANGHQPMRSPDGRFTLVFNGAIYNHRELRAELRGHWEFRTECDTEVLLAAYAKLGAACLPRLRGMFAFAVWDNRERSLFLARDPLGIKPLYYARLRDRGLLFASELNALIASGQISTEIDPTSVGEYLAWFSAPAPRTIYREATCLPPGHSLLREADGRLKVETWWRLPAPRKADAARTYPEFVQGLREKLEDSIRAHRLADVPVGAFLSGGMDSTAVVGLMSRLSGQPLKTFSLSFEEPGYSEHLSAQLAASTFGTQHREELLSGARIAADLPKILASFDQPTGDGINTYYASQLARSGGVTAALSGLGGDELFGGYPSFQALPQLTRLLPVWRRLPARWRQSAVAQLRVINSSRLRKLADFLAHGRDLHELASLQRRVLPETTRLHLLAPEALALAQRLGPNHPRLDDFVAELLGADAHQIISAWELRTYMADVLLRDSDVFSMAHSLELRVPFVDTVLLNWLWAQRAEWKGRRGGISKRALADATRDVVPAAIRQRPKRGFSLPFAHWMRRELRPFLDETFSDAALDRCPWLDRAAAQQIWRDYLHGHDSRAWSRVWTIAILISFAGRKNPAQRSAA